MTSKLRLAATGVAALACVGLLSACIQAPPQTDPTSSASPTPTGKPALEVLHDALAKADGQPYQYTLTYGTVITADGYRDATGEATNRDVVIGSQAQGTLRYVDLTVYAKIDVGALSVLDSCLATINNKWMIGDQRKIESRPLVHAVLPVGESLTLKSFIDGIVTADYSTTPTVTPSPGASAAGALTSRAEGDTLVTGTIDLSKSSPVPVPVAQINLLGDKKIVPFSATLDADGYLSTILVTMPAIGAFPAAQVTTTFHDYGVAQDVAAPVGAIQAPDCAYTFLP